MIQEAIEMSKKEEAAREKKEFEDATEKIKEAEAVVEKPDP